jgi:hypothetical protein
MGAESGDTKRGDETEETFDLELGDIASSAPTDNEQVGLAQGSDIHLLVDSPPLQPPRTLSPHDLEAVLLRYLLDIDEPDRR